MGAYIPFFCLLDFWYFFSFLGEVIAVIFNGFMLILDKCGACGGSIGSMIDYRLNSVLEYQYEFFFAYSYRL
jgi:hypothetical protein